MVWVPRWLVFLGGVFVMGVSTFYFLIDWISKGNIPENYEGYVIIMFFALIITYQRWSDFKERWLNS